MPQNNYVVQYRNGKWEVDAVGVPRLDTFNKKSEAVKHAKAKAKKFGDSQVEIYKKDGALQDTVTYEKSKTKSKSSNGFFNDLL